MTQQMPKGIPNQCQYCYFCDEPLRWVPQMNPETKELDDIMICYPCDQAFMWKPGQEQLGVMPFDSRMKLITVKCESCPTTVHHKQKMIYLVDDMMIFKPYCSTCAIKQVKKDFPNSFKDLNEKNVRNVEDLHSMYMHQKVMNDPEKMKKVMAQPAYKEMLKDMRLD